MKPSHRELQLRYGVECIVSPVPKLTIIEMCVCAREGGGWGVGGVLPLVSIDLL
jgi:hypothetical protein